MKYEPSLDGVRALAILGVLVFHIRPVWLKGGFTGVDVFFVLSGYLITSVILHDIRDKQFTMREFYTRRIQRLLPNAAVTVLVTVLFSRLFLLPSSSVAVADHGLFTVFNLSNFFILEYVGGYWGANSASTPLLHTWSLAVEEQFYLFFPAVLSLFLFIRKDRLFALTLSLTLASFGLSLLFLDSHPSGTFYMLPTRAWEPLLGAVLATYRLSADARNPLRMTGLSRSAEVLGWAGLAAIGCGFFLITESERFPGWVALIPTVGSLAVLISIADGKTRLAQWLSAAPMALLGKLSYSLYLWHWPMIVMARNYAALMGYPRVAGTLAGAALGIIFALIAYETIEKPLRKRGKGRRQKLLIIGALFLLSALTCIVISGQGSRLNLLDHFDRPSFRGMAYDTVATGDTSLLASSVRYRDVEFPPAELRPEDTWKEGGVIHRWGDTLPRVVVLGSSHALMYGGVIDDLCKELGLSVAFLSSNGLTVFSKFATTRHRTSFVDPEKSERFYEARREWIAQWQPEVIFVIDRWDSYADDIAHSEFDDRLAELVEEFSPFAGRIVFLSQVPVLSLGESDNLREFASWGIETRGSLPTIHPAKDDPLRRASVVDLDKVSKEYPQVQLIRAHEPFENKDGSVRYASDRNFFYGDDDHLSQVGAAQLRDAIREAIAGPDTKSPSR